MSAGEIISWALLVLGVGVGVVCGLGVLAMRNVFDRLHYADTAGVCAALVCAAVVVREGITSTIGLKAVLIGIFFLVTSPVLAHVTGRVALLRERGDLHPRPDEIEEE